MEAMISDLLNRFEKGALSRRGLIQGLAMLTAAGAQAQDTAIRAAASEASPTTRKQGFSSMTPRRPRRKTG